MLAHRRRLIALGFALAGLAQPAAAQMSDMPDHGAERRLAVGGDVGVTIAPPDDRTYFNYTSYDLDGLRMASLRLYGELHLRERLSVVGELRTQNTDVHASALYVRWSPIRSRALSIQAGRIPPVIGAFGRRAYSRDNAVLGTPLAYQYLTSLRPDALPATTANLLLMRGRGWQPSYPVGSAALRPGVPLLSSAEWDTGVEAAWSHSRVDLAGAVTLGSPAEPVLPETNHRRMWSGRAATRLPGSVTVGVSGARAGWIEDSALDLTPGGRQTPSTQTLVGVDTEFGISRWLFRAEWLRTAFDLPIVADPSPAQHLTAQAGFVEVRYRPFPRVQIGLRADRLLFGEITEPVSGARVTWDANVRRIEAMAGVRLTRSLEVRAGWQDNHRESNRGSSRGMPVVGLLYWF